MSDEIYARGLTQGEYQKETIRRKKWHKKLAADLCMQGWGTYLTDRVDYEFIYALVNAVSPHALADTVTNHEETEEVFVRRLKEAFDNDPWGAKMRQRDRRPIRQVEEDFEYPSPT